MNPFEFVLGILVIIFVYKLLDARIRSRSLSDGKESVDKELNQRLAALEERIRVLERIVTDDGYALNREFKNL